MSNIDSGKNKFFALIKEKPARLFWLVFPFILVIGVVAGLFYMHKINQVEQQTIPIVNPDSVQQQTDLKLEMPKSTPKADVMTLSQPSSEMVQEGKKLFTTNCVSCHGANGKGDGVAAAALKPSPRNFTSKKGWVNGPKLTEIFKTLSEGVKGSAMVAFDNFSPKQKFELAQYIRKTFVPNPPTDSKEDLQDLIQTYNLNEAQKSPGQIPVADAMRLIAQENQPKYNKMVDLIKKIKDDATANSSEAAKLFESITKDKMRAVTTLSNTNEWHNNQRIFVDLIVNEINENGFNDKVHDLSGDQWKMLYNYLSKVIG